MRVEDLAVDPPVAVTPDHHEEVRIARAAPVERFQSRHRGTAGALDSHDAGLQGGAGSPRPTASQNSPRLQVTVLPLAHLAP